MQILIFAALILSSLSVRAACDLRSASSAADLRMIATQVSTPATASLPKVIVSGSDSLTVTDANGENVTIDDQLALSEGMTISSKVNGAQLILPSTGQVVELSAETVLQIASLNKAANQNICSVRFEIQSGQASFTSNHIEREKFCKPVDVDAFEVATNAVAITPEGTKYNVDLSRAIAELNGESYSGEENVSVTKGSVRLRLIKVKKSRSKSAAKDRKVANSSYTFEEQNPIVIKAGKKAKIKKSKQDRQAEIQIVYPD